MGLNGNAQMSEFYLLKKLKTTLCLINLKVMQNFVVVCRT